MKFFDMTNLLAKNSYPGRGIALGLCPDGRTAALVYFIMGRSTASRSRVFFRSGDDVMIRLLGGANPSDPSLILYAPVRTLDGATIVANGDQSDTIRDALRHGSTFEKALQTRTFEPDAPHFTPRISGLLDFSGGFSYRLSILKPGGDKGLSTLRGIYDYVPLPGAGHFIHTYQKDASPLPGFTGDPLPINIPADLDAFADDIWAALDGENKVSLYVRFTDIASGAYTDRLINKYD